MPLLGIEPKTFRLQGGCSTPKLKRRTPGGARTHGLAIRSRAFYPTELQGSRVAFFGSPTIQRDPPLVQEFFNYLSTAAATVATSLHLLTGRRHGLTNTNG
jgi:hypothetical protein